MAYRHFNIDTTVKRLMSESFGKQAEVNGLNCDSRSKSFGNLLGATSQKCIQIPQRMVCRLCAELSEVYLAFVDVL